MKIGIHEVQRELGRGGMGVVYAVTSPHLPSERALKLLLPGADPDSRTRFRREAELLARIRHPGVVAIHEIGEAEQGLYLVMDLVPGEPLDHVLRGGPATAEQARTWILEVAEALAALHDAGLLHRDLKPANLILRPDGHLVLLDFGLARSAGGSSLTETGGITGSPGFLAPEQARGLNVLTPAVDVHGLGTTLFAFLSGGVPPFLGGTVLATVAAVLNQEADWPADLPPDLVAVGRRALAKEPSERFADAGAFAAALREPEPAKTSGEPSSQALLWLALCLALCLLLAGGAWLARSPSAPPLARTAAQTPPPPLTRPWPSLPPDPGPRAAWFRDAWRRWRAGESPSSTAARDFQRLQRKPLQSLSVRSTEQPRAQFWGEERWVRRRSGGLDWGQVRRSPLEIEGDLTAEARGIVDLFAGEGVLTLFNLGAQPQAWRITSPAQTAQVLAFPPAKFLEGAGLETYTFSPRRLCLATTTQAWELDLGQPEAYRLALDYPQGKIEDLLYAPGDRLLLGISAPGGAELRFAAGEPRVVLSGVPKALAAHPLLPVVAIGDQNGRVLIWDYEAGGGVLPLREHGQTHRVRQLRFDPAGRFLYTTAALTSHTESSRDERGQIQVWRGSEGAWRGTRRIELPWAPDQLALSADGAWLLVSSRHGKVLLYAAGDRAGP